MADEDIKPEEVAEEGPKAVWEERNEFKINGHMREVIKATIGVCEAQIKLYKRKIEKLQYGS